MTPDQKMSMILMIGAPLATLVFLIWVEIKEYVKEKSKP